MCYDSDRKFQTWDVSPACSEDPVLVDLLTSWAVDLKNWRKARAKQTCLFVVFFVVKNDIWTQTLGQLERQLPQRKSSQDCLDCCLLMVVPQPTFVAQYCPSVAVLIAAVCSRFVAAFICFAAVLPGLVCHCSCFLFSLFEAVLLSS